MQHQQLQTPIDPYPLCDNDQNGTEDFDLITWGEDEILNGLTNVTLNLLQHTS